MDWTGTIDRVWDPVDHPAWSHAVPGVAMPAVYFRVRPTTDWQAFAIDYEGPVYLRHRLNGTRVVLEIAVPEDPGAPDLRYIVAGYAGSASEEVAFLLVEGGTVCVHGELEGDLAQIGLLIEPDESYG